MHLESDSHCAVKDILMTKKTITELDSIVNLIAK